LTFSFFFGNFVKLFASICIESITFYKVLFESLKNENLLISASFIKNFSVKN
jgi:hypothetical protein